MNSANGAEYVVDERFRKAAMGPGGSANANLRTTFQKIIRRASLQPWPRPCHNLRASRETALVETYPVPGVTAWLGNTPTVALRHSPMTTDEHFARASGSGVEPDPADSSKAAQQAHARDGRMLHVTRVAHEKTPVLPRFAVSCDLSPRDKVEDRGLEPLTSCMPCQQADFQTTRKFLPDIDLRDFTHRIRCLQVHDFHRY